MLPKTLENPGVSKTASQAAILNIEEISMKGPIELLLKFEGIDIRAWELEVGVRLGYLPEPDSLSEELSLEVFPEFVEFVREIVNEEFALGIWVEVEGLTTDGVIGTVDFPDSRAAAIADVERRVREACGELPLPCRAPEAILDRLLCCTEIVRVPDFDPSELGRLKRECGQDFQREGYLLRSVRLPESDLASIVAAPLHHKPK